MGSPSLPNKAESLAKPGADTRLGRWFSTNGEPPPLKRWLASKVRTALAVLVVLGPASPAVAQAWIGEFAGRMAAQQAEQQRQMQCVTDSATVAQWMFQNSSGKDLREFLQAAAWMAGQPERDAKGRPLIRAC